MAGAGRRSDHVREQLVVSRATPGLQDTDASIRIKACVLAAVAEVDEVRSGVIEKAVRIRLYLENGKWSDKSSLNSNLIAGCRRACVHFRSHDRAAKERQ
jgi:hypothetical protein